jgi:gas vesicle protein
MAMMRNGFTKGLVIGSLIGASVSMMMNPDMMRNMSRRGMMKNGRSFMRKSGHFIGDVIDMLR